MSLAAASLAAPPAKAQLELEVRPPSPFRLPRYGGQDGTIGVRASGLCRYFEIDGVAITVRVWQPARDRVRFLAELIGAAPIRSDAAPRGEGIAPGADDLDPDSPAVAERLETAVERMRFALGVDDDLSDFYRRFKGDRLLGRYIRLHPYLRPARTTLAWDALAWAIVAQLIEARRASLITRRIVRRWGRPGPEGLHDTPTVKAIADRAPAELESCDLSARRAIAMRLAAREVTAGRIDPASESGDAQLFAIPQIGPWTVQCLGLYGRGDPDSLPAGDLDYLKLVGWLAGLGRRADVEEVEHFFEPYRPYRGLAGEWLRRSIRVRI